jgi:ribonuclease Z
MLAVSDARSTLLIDCGGDVIERVLSSGLEIDSIAGLIVTHEHPDHVSGFPLLMEKLWLAGRRRPLPVFGIAPAIAQADRCWSVFNTSNWSGVPEIEWHEIAHESGAVALASSAWLVTAAPGVHGVPVIGLRIESRTSGQTIAYSCDTEPSESIAELARHSAILVHEANGEGSGHTSAEQAAAIAAQAEARRLVLVHLPRGIVDEDLTEARRIFPETELGQELGQYVF